MLRETTAQSQEAMGGDAALQESVELILDEPRQFTVCAGFSVRNETGEGVAGTLNARAECPAIAVSVAQGSQLRVSPLSMRRSYWRAEHSPALGQRFHPSNGQD